ncbi:amidase [Albimonas sp. CAU 1670]|uniref:amidase family protein n=1 Tax=Albimonas sp. CAU 1670 TaxID=3032599 RepID=UPI0023DBB486|nr:amidase [Albimonas sp. CAU 1670]MDF2235607.1 amidase [Albimonas sp. CAU 1670]
MSGRIGGDATALARAIADGRLTAAEAMEAALLAAETDPLGAIARLDPALGRAGAARADAILAAGATAASAPFRGLPFLGKDLGASARGLAACGGNAALRERTPDPEADDALFARFRAAGLVPFGLTTVPEFGNALTSEPPGAPPARNPWNPALSPGGSSGGAAAAVASGIVAMAHATDAAGSIRVPAACCGLVGLKPSRGATPMGPGFSNWLNGLVGEGVLARSVRDVAAIFAPISGEAQGPVPDPALRGIPATPRVALAISPAVSEASAAAAREAAQALGGPVHALDPAAWAALSDRAAAVADLVLAVSLAEWVDAAGLAEHEIAPISAAAARHGRALSAPAFFAATREAAGVAHAMWALFADADVIVAPVLADGPPEIGAFDPASTDLDAHHAKMDATAPGVALANVSGFPALALPFGMEGGLPRSFQMIAPFGSGRALLALAARLEDLAPCPPFPRLAGLPEDLR